MYIFNVKQILYNTFLVNKIWRTGGMFMITCFNGKSGVPQYDLEDELKIINLNKHKIIVNGKTGGWIEAENEQEVFKILYGIGITKEEKETLYEANIMARNGSYVFGNIDLNSNVSIFLSENCKINDLIEITKRANAQKYSLCIDNSNYHIALQDEWISFFQKYNFSLKLIYNASNFQLKNEIENILKKLSDKNINIELNVILDSTIEVEDIIHICNCIREVTNESVVIHLININGEESNIKEYTNRLYDFFTKYTIPVFQESGQIIIEGLTEVALVNILQPYKKFIYKNAIFNFGDNIQVINENGQSKEIKCYYDENIKSKKFQDNCDECTCESWCNGIMHTETDEFSRCNAYKNIGSMLILKLLDKELNIDIVKKLIKFVF